MMLDESRINIEQVQRKPLKEEIFEILHKRIISGKYRPGDWLRQEEIASQLGVSQTPVREALDLLVSAGLAEREPFKGVRVLQLSHEEIAESFGMRLFLECAAVTSAAKMISEGQVAALFQLVDQTKDLLSLNDMSTQWHLNREFHRGVVDAGGNALLTRIYITVMNSFPDWMLYEYMFRHPELLVESLQQEYNEHLEIVKSLAVHDVQKSISETRKHILNLGDELVDYLDVPKDIILSREIPQR